jgi:hypothetical protein
MRPTGGAIVTRRRGDTCKAACNATAAPNENPGEPQVVALESVAEPLHHGHGVVDLAQAGVVRAGAPAHAAEN